MGAPGGTSCLSTPHALVLGLSQHSLSSREGKAGGGEGVDTTASGNKAGEGLFFPVAPAQHR